MNEKCTNCGRPVSKRGKLCDECKREAAELDRRTRRPTDEETMDILERKPRSWKDIFYPARAK
jgi:predicted amidophosphoribosyltransferase